MDPSIKHQTMKPFNITTNRIIKLMCFTADFVIVSLKDIPHIGYLAVIVLEHI
jgi:hypothetical protein